MTLPKGARTQPVLPFSLRHGAKRGFEREPAADEQEDKRDALERVRRASRPEGRRPGWPEPNRSNPAFGTPLPEEMRSLGYPTKNNLRGTIAILKGNLAESQVPFSRIFGPSG